MNSGTQARFKCTCMNTFAYSTRVDVNTRYTMPHRVCLNCVFVHARIRPVFLNIVHQSLRIRAVENGTMQAPCYEKS